jgi:hypothetical protein
VRPALGNRDHVMRASRSLLVGFHTRNLAGLFVGYLVDLDRRRGRGKRSRRLLRLLQSGRPSPDSCEQATEKALAD